MLQITLHLTPSSRLWTFQLLGFEVFQVLLQKKPLHTQSRDFRPVEDKGHFSILCVNIY
jgi:hypothetical protein